MMRIDRRSPNRLGDGLGLPEVKVGDRYRLDAGRIVYKIKNGAVSHTPGAEYKYSHNVQCSVVGAQVLNTRN